MRQSVTAGVVAQLTERFEKLLSDPIIKAAITFEHARWPSFESDKDGLDVYGNEHIDTLLSHLGTLLGYLSAAM